VIIPTASTLCRPPSLTTRGQSTDPASRHLLEDAVSSRNADRDRGISSVPVIVLIDVLTFSSWMITSNREITEFLHLKYLILPVL
jgi:hypothetical protein